MAGCAAAPLVVEPYPDGLPRARGVLYLIGDAGDATEETPVLRQLKSEIQAVPEGIPTIVAFLGDNVYGNGVRDATSPGFAEDSVRLETQVDVLRGTDAHGIFVPGNHDWADGGPAGLQRMINQTDFIARRAAAGVNVEVVPPNGCPGPITRELGDVATLFLIDTHWWLHDEDRRVNIECDNLLEADVLVDLAETLGSQPDTRRSVVLAHHPLQTYGKHGGYFSARYVFFPITEVVPWLYLPVPLVYPVARNSGWTDQDMSGSRNKHMRAELESIFRLFPREPMIFAAGHEHTLQVFDGISHGVGTHLVSGAGSKLTDAIDVGNARFLSGRQHGENGFMKLEFYDDRTAQLFIYTDGRACRRPGCPTGPVLRYVERLR